MFAGGACRASDRLRRIAQTPRRQDTIRVNVTGTNIQRVDSETASPVEIITHGGHRQARATRRSPRSLRDITANNNGPAEPGLQRRVCRRRERRLAARPGRRSDARCWSTACAWRRIRWPTTASATSSTSQQHPVHRGRAHRSAAGRRVRHLRFRCDRRRGQRHPEEDLHRHRHRARRRPTTKGGGTQRGTRRIMQGFGKPGTRSTASSRSSTGTRTRSAVTALGRGLEQVELDRPGRRTTFVPARGAPTVANPILLTPYLQRPGGSTRDRRELHLPGQSGCNWRAQRQPVHVYEDTWDADPSRRHRTSTCSAASRSSSPRRGSWR